MSLSDWRTYQNVVSSQQSVTVPNWRTTAGEYPEPNFEFLRRIYTDPDVFTNCNFISNRALGEGFHFECQGKDAPNYLRSECEDFLTSFFESVKFGDGGARRGLENLAKITLQEETWGGTHILELIDPDDIMMLAPVPLTSIWKWHRDMQGDNIAIYQFPQINAAPLTPARYLTYCWNPIDASPWGHGLAYPLSVPRIGPRGQVLPPLIQTWWQMQADAGSRLHRLAVPHPIFGVPAMSPTDAKAMSEAVSDPDSGESFITNAPVTVAFDSPTTRANMQPEFDLIGNRVNIDLMAMMGTMISSDKGFSFASSSNGFTAVDIVVWDLQNNWSSTTTNGLVIPVADQNGFDSSWLKPAVVMNIPDKVETPLVADIDKAFVDGWITKLEAREIARQVAKWPLEEGLPAELQQQTSPLAQPQQNMQKSQIVSRPGNSSQQQQQIDPRMAQLAARAGNGNNGNGH